MSQVNFDAPEHDHKRKHMRRALFLGEMEHVVPWKPPLDLVEPFHSIAGRKRQPYLVETVRRVRLMRSGSGLSDPTMQEAP